VRQALLIVVLVAASFLGGALVNGPGLRWVQVRLLRSLGLSDLGEIASINLKATAPSDAVTGGPEPGKPEADAMPGPLAPMPSLVAEGEAPKRVVPDHRSETSAKSKASKQKTADSKLPSSNPLPLAIRAPSPPSLPPSSSQGSSRKDANLAPAVLNSVAALLSSTSSPEAGSLFPSSSSPASGMKPAPDGGGDWVVLERKMQSLGVSRFTIEGQPGGRVVFSCLIPLAGRQAVAQRFEAEGDDIVRTAQAAMRRIALWQATESTSR
jgi:hypothetical protein